MFPNCEVGAIHEYLEASNQAPQPFVWTASAQDILAKVERAAKTHAIVAEPFRSGTTLEQSSPYSIEHVSWCETWSPPH